MKDKLTIYYSIENGGDGSAYPVWFETEKLAQWHQDNLDEGWGESCTGSIAVEGNNMNCPNIMCEEGYYLELLLEGYENETELDKFREEFFFNGLPEFTTKIVDKNHYGVFLEERLVHTKFSYPEKKANQKGVDKLLKLVNSQNTTDGG